tara:strand:- start:62 stop:379 length:318 start_codon:yes stop_codon:yes gene_type:complete
MKIEIKKSEALTLRQTIRKVAWLIYNDKELWDRDVYDTKLNYNHKVSLLKNFTTIEAKINKGLREIGYLKKRTGNTRCWELWTTTSKRWLNRYSKMEEKYQEENK